MIQFGRIFLIEWTLANQFLTAMLKMQMQKNDLAILIKFSDTDLLL